MRVHPGTRVAAATAVGAVLASVIIVAVANDVALPDLRIGILAAGALAIGLLVFGMLTGLARSIGPAIGLLGACYTSAHLSGTSSVSGAALVLVATCLFLAADLAYATGDILRHEGTVAVTRARRTLALGSGAIIASGLVAATAGRTPISGLGPLLVGAGVMLALAAMVVTLTRRVPSQPVSEDIR